MDWHWRKVLARGAIDRPVIFGFAANAWQILAAPISLLLIAKFLTPAIQGYYFTFGSVLALSVFAEMGLGRVVIQFASHEWASVSLGPDGEISGDAGARSRLASLFKFSSLWYSAVGVTVAGGIGLAGYVFFSWNPHPEVVWVWPWFSLCFLTGVDLYLSNFTFMLEGCNQLSQVYFYQFIRRIVTSSVLWLVLFLGGNLWIAPAALVAAILWTLIYLGVRYRAFLSQLLFFPITSKLSWGKDLWPMQWRIAVSWISGYFAFSLFTPVIFHYWGPVEAGRIGMTWKLASTLMMGATAVIIPKGPQFGILIAKKAYQALDKLFYKTVVSATLIALAGSSAVFLLVFVLYRYHYPLASRMLGPLPTAFFLMAAVLMQVSIAQSTYLRAYRKEPFMVLSVAAGALIALSTWALGSRYGCTAVAAGYLAVTALFSVPCGALIWRRCRKAWNVPGGLNDPAEIQPAYP